MARKGIDSVQRKTWIYIKDCQLKCYARTAKQIGSEIVDISVQ